MSTLEQTTGTVFDIGYQGYAGERHGRAHARSAIYRDGIRIALGFGRGVRAKVLPWAFIIILAAVGLIMAIVAGGIDRQLGAGTAKTLNLPSHSDYYGMASMLMFVFAALVGPEMLCPDRRQGTINLYLVRPITGTDYIVSRWAAFLTVMTIASWVPQLILLLGLSMSDPDPMKYLQTNWRDIPHFMLAGFAIAAYAVTLSMLVASFTTRRAYASVVLVGLVIVSTPVTIGTAQHLKDTIGPWISMFNLSNIPVHVNDLLFNDVSEITKFAPARSLAAWIRVAWYFAWVLIPGTILWARYRKIQP
jgi:ABC-2 type transport system permease protein